MNITIKHKFTLLVVISILLIGFAGGYYFAQVSNANDTIHCDKPVCEPGENE